MSRGLRQAIGAVSAAGAAGYALPAITGIPIVTRWIRSGQPDRTAPPRICLTFDDGPHPDGTPAILDLLAETRSTATFFVIGEQLARFPALGRRIVDAGHELAVHGWDHRCLLAVDPASTRRGIRRTAEEIGRIAGRPPRRFRPPYGVASWAALGACRRYGLAPTWWTAWGRDWSAAATPQSVQQHVDRALTRCSSATVLLHDSDAYGTPGSWRTTVAATGALLRRWAQTGTPVRSLDDARRGSPG